MTPEAQKPVQEISVTALLQCTNLGGMEKVAYSLFDQLQMRGFRVKIATARVWGPGMPRVLAIDPEVKAFDYRGRFGWRSFPAFQRHVKTVCKSSDKVWVIGTCASCLAAAHLTGKRILMSHHYHHFENCLSRLRWTAFYLATGSRLEAITYPTEFTRNEASRIAPWLKPRMHVVRNGFDVHYVNEEKRLADKRAARAELQMPQDAFLIGNGGWLIPRKRFDVFLRTAQQVSLQLPHARFYICGGGPEENSLRTLALELGIADKVHFQGWIQNMDPYYRAWDAQLFNTDFDALGCTPLEAASHGCLCVASCHYGGLSEFIKDGQTGFLLNQHDPEKLAKFLVKLARDEELALKIRRLAVVVLAQEFSNEKALGFYEKKFRAGRV
ncbi:MAG: glycosyltransferase family 4 protein [Limisphaerales bacterium]